jgi:hypothetical protein
MIFPEGINTASIERFGILYLTVVHYISIRVKLIRYGENLVAGSKSLCLDNTLRPLTSRTTSIYKNPSSLISTLTKLSYSKIVVKIMKLI